MLSMLQAPRERMHWNDITVASDVSVTKLK
jgi:hypothetical protein